MQNQRSHFDIPEGINYLNGAYMSPMLKEIAQIGEAAVRKKLRPFDSSVDDFFTDYRSLRQEFARMINAPDPDQVVVVPSVSYGISSFAKNLNVRGKEILVLQDQFPSNYYPWEVLAREQDGKIKTVKAPSGLEERGSRWNQEILSAINQNTAVVAMSHTHWADGTRFDLKAIRQRTLEVGAKLIIDGTQSVGALPFDVQEIQPDGLVCAGYKWLMGPYGLGLAYFSPSFNEGKPLEENWINRKNSEDFTGLVDYETEYQPGAQRFGMGEQSNFVLMPMLLAALRKINEWGVENIQSYCKKISQEPIEQLKQFGFWVEDEPYRASHLFGIRNNEIDARALGRELELNKIYVSVRGNSIRVSPYVHNTEEQLFQLVEVLKSVTYA